MNEVVAPTPSEILREDITRHSKLRSMFTWLVETAAIMLLIFLVGLVLANSLGRYLFSMPLPWTEEVVTALLMWLGALGITIGALKNELISCAIWTRRLTGLSSYALVIFQSVFSIAVVVVIGVLAWRYLGIFGSDRTPILGISKGVAISGILATCVGLGIAFAFNIIEGRKN
ncbi:TRAP transporter small permease [Aliirhizobium smilacinae]|uniref:TRAP transporter small permease protein n=1 Tax=Aliirhizobium smilacinae TaxID=1395944 RepID=A0A5C4XIT7_9HYPH|nr:TRAP transporter small permease subunit [Rhizobium smilacinae]TNM63373.1 TRAP transporter small permease subunit [Rhizobium smilacinae]